MDLCDGLCFLLGFGNSLSLSIEGGFNGSMVKEVMNQIIKGHQARGTWRQWTTLESSAKMLRERRFRPYWTPSGTITVRTLESAGRYYARCHLLGETPDEAMSRIDEYKQLMGMIGLDSAKADVTALIRTEQSSQMQRLASNKTLFSKYQRAMLHRCYIGPPGVGRRTVARLYARILWRLGIVEGMETTTLSLSSLVGLSRRAIDRCIKDTFRDTTKVGAVIVEDMCVDGYGVVSRKTAYDDARSEDSEGDESYRRHQSHDSDDSPSYNRMRTSCYPEHKIRPLVLDLLAASVKMLNAQGTGPVLIFVGLATSPSNGNSARLPQSFVNAREREGSPRLSISSSLQQLFPSESQTVFFEPYSVDELSALFRRRLTIQGAPNAAFPSSHIDSELRDVMSIHRLRPSFDNVCFVECIAAETECSHPTRAKMPDVGPGGKEEDTLQPSATNPETESVIVKELGVDGQFAYTTFQNLIGLNHIAAEFRSIHTMATTLRRVRQQDPQPYIPFLFIFSGPSGTGKTSILNSCLVPLYFSMGLLDNREVVTCNVSELILPLSEPEPLNEIGRLSSRTTKETALVSKTKVRYMLSLAFGKVLHIRGYRVTDTDSTRSYSGAEDSEDPTVLRDRLLSCITEYIEEQDQRWKHKLVVVLEEDTAVGTKPGSTRDATLAAGPFTCLQFPAINDPGVIMQILQKKVAKASITIQNRSSGIINTANAESNALAQTSRKVDMMFVHIARRPAFSGRELDEISKDIVQYVYGLRRTLPPLKPTQGSDEQPKPFDVSLNQLAMILERRYRDQP